MTPERKEQIRKECEAEAYHLFPENIIGHATIVEHTFDLHAGVRKAVFDILYSERIKAEELIEAGEAVVDRWDTPQWEWDKRGHTAGIIADLRNAIAKYRTP